MRFYTLVAFVLSGILLVACNQRSAYTNDPETIAKGRKLFEMQCASCHNFRQTGIGPALGGITTVVSDEWLQRFIRNPARMISGGDNRAVAAFEKFNTYMPSFETLSDADLKAILAYMHTYPDKPNSTAAAGLQPLDDPIPQKIPESGIILILKEVLTAPPTAKNPPVARINKMIPESGRQFISDLNGILYEIKDQQWIPFLKMEDYFEHFIAQPGLATGLGSFAFHPEYDQNGIFYTSHTEDPKTSAPADFSYTDTIPRTVRWVLDEWKHDDPTSSVFSGTHGELMRIDMVSQIHGMQEIAFNPHANPGDQDYGLMYIGIGDGGAVENGYAFLVQNQQQPWGTILRIDPAGNNSMNGHYGIPSSNPDKSEVYALGFRNPHRIFWDADGRMLASDIGHTNIEELNIIEKGRNYGWPEREGTFRLFKNESMDKVYSLETDDAGFGFTYPVIQVDHDEIAAISSGYIYYGKQIPEIEGYYLFGGIINGRVFLSDASDFKQGKQSAVSEVQLQFDDGNISSFRERLGKARVDLRFGMDAAGELYILTKADGKVYQITGIKKSI
ncbi:PQQ-dependent sugar dehydrogenase [Fulvivirga sedimenti]|uniref:PQQ-dependent sugar dehydrogenase n=1 Tax=Fulvivirga sedimenti TaxID=2879465 RepID=A0A9X1HTQ2_9BACT|nr:PQQ-dependent sugar dehydrogenase [Fulvivirga sedimenti]MCA6075455.1 PQQ-dependent sugar dehydrogenase [Fulvivirga sedimenti]MCA6076632.1 PQQ-dependent sugar dehydrogenase [Fulvivirga sedimenti]MCA6077760.1 PQQ-dependent sugar dehydrogenase [Fulvivirga sedimenti]